MNYIRRHWRGELSLSVSFWVNVFLLNVAIRLFNAWFSLDTIIEHPQIAAKVSLGFIAVQLICIYPWQIIGLWRAANRHIGFKGKALWARAAQAIVILGVLATFGRLSASWPTYEELYSLAFKKDPWSTYTLELKKDNTIIHLAGGLGFGASRDVSKLLKENTKVSSIILDSAGGRLYEGRELAKIITKNSLDTYSLKGCFSACVTAFIAGKNRYLATGANLALHEYSSSYGNLLTSTDLKAEQEKDLRSFQRQGVSKDFLDRLFAAASDDLWYPTLDELIGANVIHGVINASDLSPIQYKLTKSDIEDAFMELSFFKAIKKYDLETYNKIIEEFNLQIKKGASKIELQHSAVKYLNVVAGPALSRTSTHALMQFGKAIIHTLRLIEKEDPFLCIKFLHPAQYGAVSAPKYLSDDQMMPMLEALNQVIVDAYENKGPAINVALAESTIHEITTTMGDNANYIEPTGLQNREDYKRTCDASIEFYELIMAEEKDVAGNLMRYLFSLEG